MTHLRYHVEGDRDTTLLSVSKRDRNRIGLNIFFYIQRFLWSLRDFGRHRHQSEPAPTEMCRYRPKCANTDRHKTAHGRSRPAQDSSRWVLLNQCLTMLTITFLTFFINLNEFYHKYPLLWNQNVWNVIINIVRH